MISYKEFLTENFKNLFVKDKSKRLIYIDEVWDILQSSYADNGGIKGKGFSSKQDIIDNIPFWKLFTRNNKILVAIF